MAYSHDTKDRLRRLYIFDALSLEMAAMQLSVPISTASRWKRDSKKAGDDWDRVKTARLIAGGGVDEVARSMLTQLIQQCETTMQQLSNPDCGIEPGDKVKLLASLSDSLNKAVAASRRIMPETSQLATALDVLRRFAEFVKLNYPQHLQIFADILERFGEQLERDLN